MKVRAISKSKIKIEVIEIAESLMLSEKKGLQFFAAINFGDRVWLILFYAHLFKAIPDIRYHTFLNTQIEECLKILEEEQIDSGLIEGFTGFFWLLNHLRKLGLVEADIIKAIKKSEGYLEQSLEADIAENNYDLLYGFIGKGIYFLESNGKILKRKILKQIIDALYATAIKEKVGISWLDEDFNGGNNPVFNLGLAHGVPAIISFLSKAYHLKISVNKCKYLISEGTDWLLGQQKKTGLSLYSYFVGAESQSRLAWCYGDLGVSFSLMHACKAIDSKEYYETALNIAVHTTTRKLSDSGVDFDESTKQYDIGFCHGTSGLAYMYLRLFQRTQNKIFLKAAKYWLHLTIESNKGADYITRYRFPFFDANTNCYLWKEDASLLSGLTGVGLTLLSFIEKVDTAWDSPFLTDIHL